jgi:glycosyltransferase involved in cell wall biosynthesis
LVWTNPTKINIKKITDDISILDQGSIPKDSLIKRINPHLGNFFTLERSASFFRKSNPKQPLVSILLYNFNYGNYLEYCFNSLINQSYQNIEIIFSDNSSTDNSWNIACKFKSLYPKLITLIKNRVNRGPQKNIENCYHQTRGEYVIEMCSDDALDINYVSECINAFKLSPESAFLITHRAILDNNNKIKLEKPFYNKSCIIPAGRQSAVYMMAAVNPSISQVMYNYKKLLTTKMPIEIISLWYGSRIKDFLLSLNYSIIYINKPLLLNRIHNRSSSSLTSFNLLQIFGNYVLINLFNEYANRENNKFVTQRYGKAISKLGRLCLRYALMSLKENKIALAKKYLRLSEAIEPSIVVDDIFIQLELYLKSNKSRNTFKLNKLLSIKNFLNRDVSYPPPKKAIDLF